MLLKLILVGAVLLGAAGGAGAKKRLPVEIFLPADLKLPRGAPDAEAVKREVIFAHGDALKRCMLNAPRDPDDGSTRASVGLSFHLAGNGVVRGAVCADKYRPALAACVCKVLEGSATALKPAAEIELSFPVLFKIIVS